uniref:Uncharacterized protein n=1 Tax=Hyaloperonospora arabidopsidis (strain Emoy2) TaxID=559515 RepID=M4BJS5_HYAAE
MNEEDEFGLNKMVRDADPMEQDVRSAVKDHPDFTFLEVAAALEDKGAMPLWLTRLPVEKDPSHWTILEVHIRPDRSWEVIKELLATLCISKGLLIAEEDAESVLFRKRVMHESMAHGMANMATFLNVYVRVGVSSSKLRVIDICTLVMNENKLLGGMMPTGSSRLWTARDAKDSHKYALDQLLGAFQSALLSQCLSMSHLYMSTPENSMDSVQTAKLDEGFAEDLKKAFSSEMKTNMRDLCIPLEFYAYDQEFACAQLIGLLEPTLKKCSIRLVGTGTNDACLKESESVIVAGTQDLSIKENASAQKEGLVPLPHEIKPVDPSPSKCQATPAARDKIYGEVISEMVQKLRSACKEDCEIRLRAKIEEKRQQVTARVEAAQSLRARAIQAIVEA